MFTLDKSVLRAVYVGKHSDTNPHLLYTRDCIMERSFILVNVVNLLSEVQPLLDINSFMLGKGHTSVANVGSLYAKNLHLFICKDATTKKTAMFAVNVQDI